MICKKLGKRSFAALAGKITNDSYSTTIKKLTLLNTKRFVQLVPARLCAGYDHVFFALEHAFSAIDSGTAFSRRPELEFLLHFFGEKQLERALGKARFEKGEELVLVIGGEGKNWAKAAGKALAFAEGKIPLGQNHAALMDFYGITKSQAGAISGLENALEELVIEKISMVALER